MPYSAPVVPATGSAGWNPYGITPTTGIWNPLGTPTTPTTTGAIPAGAPATLPYVPTNVPQTTTTSNLADLPNIETLTKAINDLNIAAQQQANVSRFPGEAGSEAASTAATQAALGGQVSPSTIALLKQQGAEQNVGTGRDSNAAYLRALGNTSEQLIGQGQNWLTAQTNRNPVANLYDPTSQLLTAAQAGQLGLGQQAANLAQQRLALEFQRLFGPSRISYAGGSPSTDLSAYSGTGGTAMGPTAPTSSGMGNLLFPPSTAPTQTGTGGGLDAETQYWLDQLNQPEGVDTSVVDQLFPGLGGDQTLPPDWQAGVALPDTGSMDYLYAGG